MTHRSEIFGRLLKSAISSIANVEGKKTTIVEEDLGATINTSGATVERYKGGQVPSEPERVKVLAEAAVRRGYMNREWLDRFLNAARYPERDKLLDQLCPLGPQRPRPPRVYENLPAPTYSQFVMRQQAFADVLDGLQQRSAVVLVVGLGGNGKTSLAREVAARCLKDNAEGPRFDAVVWVSDKDRPGTTNLSTVLDEVARTLDYPGFTQFAHDEKRREVEQLLRRQRVLLVVDNFETVTDGALLSWLLRLPEPSKAIVTTREYRREFRRGGWPVELRGMSENEARAFVNQRLRVLKMAQLVSNETQLEPLITVTGGNPKAIEITLGLVKEERRPLQQIVDDLHGARGELFDDLFARAWSLLDEAARRVLLVATFFPTSASSEALAATADVQGYSFERAVERLTDLALLDVQQVDVAKEARYALHPLVRVFAGARLEEQKELEAGARDRWLQWYFSIIDGASKHWHELDHLRIFDIEADNVEATISWMFKAQRFTDVLGMSDILGYYYYVRGFWHRQEILNHLCTQAALVIGDFVAEGRALLNLLRVSILQGDKTKSRQLVYAIEKAVNGKQLEKREELSFRHGFAMFAMLNKDLAHAELLFRENMAEAQDNHLFTVNRSRNWLADCLYQQGEWKEAKDLFELSLQDSAQINYFRSITFCEVRLASIALDLQAIENAESLLRASKQRAEIYQDRRDLALIHNTYARLHTLRNDLPAARASLAEAIDLFERLGMRRELAEARAALADLDAKEASAG